jgi:hypothetical protein
MPAVKCRAALAVLAGLLTAGCQKGRVQPVSALPMDNPESARQLLGGFYGIESTWRWTARDFSVVLSPPPGSERNGARLVVRVFIPPAHIEATGPVTLNAVVDGTALVPETFATGGPHTYLRSVPGDALYTNLARVDFCLDKTAPPTKQDPRELGLVVTSIALEANRPWLPATAHPGR